MAPQGNNQTNQTIGHSSSQLTWMLQNISVIKINELMNERENSSRSKQTKET